MIWKRKPKLWLVFSEVSSPGFFQEGVVWAYGKEDAITQVRAVLGLPYVDAYGQWAQLHPIAALDALLVPRKRGVLMGWGPTQ